MGINQSITLETARGDCYRLLAACFYQPQKSIFIDEGLLKNLASSLQQVCPEAAVFSSEMEKNVLNYSDEELAVEYARLFVGPYEMIAPPYGSMYLDGERTVMGDSTVEVIRMYQEEGLARDSEFKDLPDHIAVELEFMYYLTFKGMKAREQADDKASSGFIVKQNIFLNRFLRSWAPQFCDRIKEGTDNGFYKSLAGCLYAFIKDNKN
ncbi:MAG: molecular chaperone TorD family protein [Nitrospirae bacterium]|nr:molecular chaperone TorD family protein [Nitrospirota bacterium]